MTSSLVGSEMCIRDRGSDGRWRSTTQAGDLDALLLTVLQVTPVNTKEPVSYTHLTLPTICSV
eukprot:12431833-Prorocentrum_lima.AAC.1